MRLCYQLVHDGWLIWRHVGPGHWWLPLHAAVHHGTPPMRACPHWLTDGSAINLDPTVLV